MELFVRVCHAVQHAHQKGVIHRDVKPSNVLVTLHDGNPVPVVIDFGVAKATYQRLTDQTIYTRLNQVVGTTLYMSPEQAELSRFGVDTRTDVYSLGVLLYELLTGTTPFEHDRLSRAAFDEVRRIIREEEPPKPSTRVSGLGETATDVSSQRGTDPARLRYSIRGDLDWIVMNALEKDRNRRYESAARFADDVENYLHDRVVEARPPSTVYQLQKAWRRNRLLLSSLGSVVVALAVGLGVAFWAYLQQRQLAEDLRVALETVRENQTEKILELVLTGDADGARAMLRAAFPDGEDDSRVRLSRAVIGAFGNDDDRVAARQELIELAESGDIATKSLLVASYFQTSAEWDYWTAVGELDDLKPNDFEEFLFRGFAFSFGVPRLAVRDLQEAKKHNRASPLTRVLLSRALHFLSQRTLDREEAIRCAEEAVHEAEVAEEIMQSDNALSIATRIDAYTKLADLRLSHSANGPNASVVASVDALVSEVRHSLTTPYDWRIHQAQMQASLVLQRNGLQLQDDVDDRIWELPDKAEISEEIAVRIIQHQYGSGNLDQAAATTREHAKGLVAFHSIGFLPLIEYEFQTNPDLNRIQKTYREIALDENRTDKGINGYNDSMLLRIVGDQTGAERRSEDFLNFFRELHSDLKSLDNFVPVAERMAGKSEHSADAILQVAKNNHGRIHFAFWLGVDALARGDRGEAERMFQVAVNTGCYHFHVYDWASIFLKKIHDPNWMPWLPPNRVVAMDPEV